MKSIAFFNNKGGVGKTSLVYHLAWMYAEKGLRVVAADLDPQANLSAMFLPEERLEELWPDDLDHPDTIAGAVAPIRKGIGDIASPKVEPISDRLGLVVGDLGLAQFEGKLSFAWPSCMDGDESAFRATSAFFRILLKAFQDFEADLVLIDVGPNLGAINRAALLAAEFVVVPLAADLFSLQGLKNLGPSLRQWREEWADRLKKPPKDRSLELPPAAMQPAGYVVLQHAVRGDRPVRAYDRWMQRIPRVYATDVAENEVIPPSVADDPACLATLKNYRSLMPMAQNALKPMFLLRPADGALGGHMNAVNACYADFVSLAKRIASNCQIVAPGG